MGLTSKGENFKKNLNNLSFSRGGYTSDFSYTKFCERCYAVTLCNTSPCYAVDAGSPRPGRTIVDVEWEFWYHPLLKAYDLNGFDLVTKDQNATQSSEHWDAQVAIDPALAAMICQPNGIAHELGSTPAAEICDKMPEEIPDHSGKVITAFASSSYEPRTGNATCSTLPRKRRRDTSPQAGAAVIKTGHRPSTRALDAAITTLSSSLLRQVPSNEMYHAPMAFTFTAASPLATQTCAMAKPSPVSPSQAYNLTYAADSPRA